MKWKFLYPIALKPYLDIKNMLEKIEIFPLLSVEKKGYVTLYSIMFIYILFTNVNCT